METENIENYQRAADFVEMYPLVDPEEVYKIVTENSDDEAVIDELQAICDRYLVVPALPRPQPPADFHSCNGTDSTTTADDESTPSLSDNDINPPDPGRGVEVPVADVAPDLTWEEVEVELTRLTVLNEELEKKCKDLECQNELFRNQPVVQPAQPHYQDPAVPDLTWEEVEVEVTRLTVLNEELEKKCKDLECQNELLRNQPVVQPAQPHPAVPELEAELRRERVAAQRETALKMNLELRCNRLQDEIHQLRAAHEENAAAQPLRHDAVRNKTERVDFEMKQGDCSLRAPSTAAKPLSTVPEIVKCIESRECPLDRFRAALTTCEKSLLLVDAVDVADEFTAFANGRRFVPALFEFYSANPASLAVFLWNFNIDSTMHFQRQREEIFSAIARCQGFIQAMNRFLVLCDDYPEVVAWVLTILWPLSPDFQSPRFIELADQVGNEYSDLNKFATGFQLLNQLKSVRTGVEHEVVLWGSHPNDPKNFRRVDHLPHEKEMQLGVYPTGGLPVGQLSRLKLNVAHDTAEEHLDRHFRLLREDQVANLRAMYANDVVQGAVAGDKKKNQQKSQCVTLAKCSLNRDKEGDVFVLTGTVDVHNKHPLLNKGRNNEWLKQSKSFFSADTIVFLKCDDRVGLGTVVKPTSVAKVHNAKNEKPSVQLVVTVRFDPSFVPRSTEKYVAISSTVQWKNLSYVLRSLQLMKTLPFEDQIVRLKDEPSPMLPSAQQLQQLNDDGKLTILQHEAITKAITHKMTLIQGPPGTGKTFVGTRLVEAIAGPKNWRAGDGVVIILSYTNHALDQLLLRVFDQFKATLGGNDGAVSPLFLRLGAPESTKEADIKKFMHDIKGNIDKRLYRDLKTRQEDAIAKLSSPQLNSANIAASIHRQYECLTLTTRESEFWASKAADPNCKWAGVPNPNFFWNLWCSGIVYNGDDDTFKKNFKLFQLEPMLSQRLELFKIPVDERQKVRDEVSAHQADTLTGAAKAKMSADDLLDEARQATRVQAIPPAVRIIGATTSFGAKNQAFLKALTTHYPNSTLLIEEAGEILEGHILACLEDKLRRVVLIGDHKQLPPKVEQYIFQRSSGKGYDLNCSMFQRMIEGSYPYIALDEQHRMFPTLSQILRKLSYPTLVDAAEITAQKVAPIPGFQHQMIFFDHEFKEGGGQEDSDSVSKCNPKEAEFVVRTAKYLSQQPEVQLHQMVILTPYLGQVKVIRESILKAGFKAALNDRDVADMSDNDGEDEDGPAHHATGGGAIRVSTIDNFQGEEADYVFVSLVRCNKEGNIGWLKEDPRITVLLSRAKKGLLLFGSRSTITAKRSNWDLVLKSLECSSTLSLKCSRHQHRFQVATVADFNRLSPEGGCSQVCAVKMECGHHCPRKCHKSDDRNHRQSVQTCSEPTTVTCSKGHTIDAACSKIYKKTDVHISEKVCQVCQKIRAVEADAQKELKALNDKRAREANQRAVNQKKLQADLEKKVAELASMEASKVLDAEKEASQIKIEGLQREINAAKERMQKQVDILRKATSEEKERVQASIKEIERRTQEQVIQIRDESAKAVDEAHALQEQAKLEKARRIADAVTNRTENIEREKAVLERLQGPIDADLKQFVQCQACGDDDLVMQEARVCTGTGREERHCHYFHTDCFDGMIKSQRDSQSMLGGEVLCIYCKEAGVVPPEAAIIPSRLVHLFASPDIAKEYDENRLLAQAVKGERDGAARAKQLFETESERDRLLRELIEEKFGKCPRCGLKFVDFDYCSAITCETCGCGFCALCLADCGKDAHRHVANCPKNPTPGEVYHSQEEYQQINKLRGQRVAFDALHAKDPATQAFVWNGLFDELMPAARP